LVTFLSFISLAFTLLLLPSYFFTLNKQSIAENKLDEFNAQNKNITSKDLDATIKDINSKLTLLSSVKAPFSIHNDILSIVLSDELKGISLSQIIFSQRKDKKFVLDVSGVASDRVALRTFKENIDRNAKVASAEMPISDYLEKTDLSFSISIIIK